MDLSSFILETKLLKVQNINFLNLQNILKSSAQSILCTPGWRYRDPRCLEVVILELYVVRNIIHNHGLSSSLCQTIINHLEVFCKPSCYLAGISSLLKSGSEWTPKLEEIGTILGTVATPLWPINWPSMFKETFCDRK